MVIDILRAILGLAVFVGLLALLSSKRSQINWRLVGGGLALQLVLAVLVLWVPLVRDFLELAASFFATLLAFSDEGAKFLFGPTLVTDGSFGAIFAFKILPTIIFFSAFSSVLYYIGLLQIIVRGFAWVMSKTMRLSGAESLAAAANVFVGQTEAPLVVRPFVGRMTQSELLCLMTGGMATIAGGVFAAYMSFLGGDNFEQQVYFGTHLLTASILSAPAAIVCAKLLLPETEEVDATLTVPKEEIGVNVFDAAMKGTGQGVLLALNVGAALIVFVAFVAMLNFVIEDWIGELTGLNEWVVAWSGERYSGFNLQFILGTLFAPVAWLVGVHTGDLMLIGQLLGEKLVLNEFYAYITLGDMQAQGLLQDPKSVVIATYALCGFANFASMGIQIGGIAVIAPERRSDLSRLALRALLAGTVACLMTAAVASVLV